MSQTVPATAQLGPGRTGLLIGYRVLNLNRTTYSAFTTTNVSEAPASSGTYNVSGGIVAPDAGGYVIFGVSGTDYAEAPIDPAPPTVAAIQSGLSTLTTSDIDARLAAYDAATGTEAAAILSAIAALNNLSSAGAQAAAAAALAAYDAATAADVTAIAAAVAAQNPDAVSGGTLYMRKAVTYDGTITGLSMIPVSWTRALFTMKTKEEALESDAIIQIQVSNPSDGSDGLLLLNGAESTPANASLSINQGAGTATIHIEDAALASVRVTEYVYDLKFFYGTSDSVSTVPATAVVQSVVTLTV